MKKKLLNYLSIFALLFTASISGQVGLTVTVKNSGELVAEIGTASAGKTIILKNNGSDPLVDGAWADVKVSINKLGSEDHPITIKAETPGMVEFTGYTTVKLGGSWINFEGVVFKDAGALPQSGSGSDISITHALIDFRISGNSNVCNNCKVTNIKIDGYNQSTAQQTYVFKWILLRGANNEISYSSFLGKHGVGSIINDNRDSAIENFHKIHHNYFANRTPQGISVVNANNDQDAIRIGNSATSLSNSSTEVYDNYFHNFVGEIEIISNKSGNNKYYNNTFENYSGALTLRHGNGCEVYNNFFLARAKSFSGGVRVIGENHKIYNNYIEGTRARSTSTTNGLAGINIHNGKTNSLLNEYYQVKNATIINNTIVNCDLGIRVGATFGAQTEPPQDVVIGNNLFLVNMSITNATSNTLPNKAIYITTQLTETAVDLSRYENNIEQTSYAQFAYDSFGIYDGGGNSTIASTDPAILVFGSDIYNILSGSPAIDHQVGSSYFLTEDILGGTRVIGARIDAGAEEFNGGGSRVPYKESDVIDHQDNIFPIVGFLGTFSNPLSVNDNVKLENTLKLYPVPVNGDYLNLSIEKQDLGNVQIIDMLGRTVIKTTINSQKGQINVNSLTNGTYIVKVQGTSKMIVKQ